MDPRLVTGGRSMGNTQVKPEGPHMSTDNKQGGGCMEMVKLAEVRKHWTPPTSTGAEVRNQSSQPWEEASVAPELMAV
eukprot:8316137-Lingulodinium_polyedra.AAC.1